MHHFVYILFGLMSGTFADALGVNDLMTWQYWAVCSPIIITGVFIGNIIRRISK